MSPLTKTARQAQIAEILTRVRVRSQEELAELLAERGVRVAQATLSRDLEELGAVRLRGAGGTLVYALPGTPGGPGSRPGGQTAVQGAETAAGRLPAGPPGGQAEGGRVRWLPVDSGDEGPLGSLGSLPRIAPELLVSAEASANLVVVRTPAGGAQLLASAIDHAGWMSILGTVAGDDTVLVISRDPLGGEDVARALVRLAERKPAGEAGRGGGRGTGRGS